MLKKFMWVVSIPYVSVMQSWATATLKVAKLQVTNYWKKYSEVTATRYFLKKVVCNFKVTNYCYFLIKMKVHKARIFCIQHFCIKDRILRTY